jgi:signal transduction histidine kinase/integral membrane sensor domain MASE1
MMAWKRFGNHLQREPWHSIWAIALTAIAYYASERLVTDNILLRIGTDTPPLNPGAGIALVGLLFYGPIAGVGIGIGKVAAALALGLPKAATVGSLLGQCLEAGLGYWFLRTLKINPRLGTMRSVVLFVLCSALLPTSLNATVSTASGFLGKVLPLSAVTGYWWSMWRSHFLGILAIAPAGLMINQGRSPDWQWLRDRLALSNLRRLFQPRTWAFVLWNCALGISGWVGLSRVHPSLPWLEYLPFLFLTGAIARFGQSAGIWGALLLTTIASWYTFRGQGLFLEQAGNLSLGITTFQGWVAIVTGLALAFGAALQERQTQIEHLQQQVVALTPIAPSLPHQTDLEPTPTDLEPTPTDPELAAPVATTSLTTPTTGDTHHTEQLIQTERLIGDVAMRIRRSLNVAEILQQTVEEVRLLLHADRVAIYQINAVGEAVVTAESVADDWPSLKTAVTPPEIAAQFQQLYQQHPLMVRDALDPENVPVPYLKFYYETFKLKASINMSLVKGGIPFGTLNVHQCSAPRQWQPFEIDLIKRLVPQVELAVQQGELYEQMQAHAYAMEVQVADRTQKLRENMAELWDINQSKDRLLHAVSHDLRTPALGMLMLLHRLAMQSGDSISLPKSMLDKMIESTNRQINLIQSLLNDYTTDTGSLTIQASTFQLTDLVQHCLETLHPLIARNQGHIDNQIPIDLPLLQGDVINLRRVLEHLITNAFQHNPPGVKITLEAAVLPDETQVKCGIIDNGIGLTAEQCQDLFQRPYLRSQTDQRLTGLGLGLFLSRQIIQAHGGSIGIDRRHDTGSHDTGSHDTGATVWFTLPLANAALTESEAEVIAPKAIAAIAPEGLAQAEAAEVVLWNE